MLPDNSVQDFPSSHIWLICPRNRAQDSCLIIPVMTDYAAFLKEALAEKIITKWLQECDTLKEGSQRAVAFVMRWNGCRQTYKSSWEVLTLVCFIQLMLAVSTLDSCIIRTKGPLLRAVAALEMELRRDVVWNDSLLVGGKPWSCHGISVSNQSLSLHVSFQPELRLSDVSGWPLWLMDTVNQMLWNPSQWKQRYLAQKGWMQIKPATQMTIPVLNK